MTDATTKNQHKDRKKTINSEENPLSTLLSSLSSLSFVSSNDTHSELLCKPSSPQLFPDYKIQTDYSSSRHWDFSSETEIPSLLTLSSVSVPKSLDGITESASDESSFEISNTFSSKIFFNNLEKKVTPFISSKTNFSNCFTLENTKSATKEATFDKLSNPLNNLKVNDFNCSENVVRKVLRPKPSLSKIPYECYQTQLSSFGSLISTKSSYLSCKFPCGKKFINFKSIFIKGFSYFFNKKLFFPSLKYI
jgi:hypothetical protein